MIKGVNKRIVEISNTDNKYFYKALLFVKSDCCDLSDRKIESEANKYLNNIIKKEPVKPGYLRRKRSIKKNVLFTLFVFGVGILSIVILSLIK